MLPTTTRTPGPAPWLLASLFAFAAAASGCAEPDVTASGAATADAASDTPDSATTDPATTDNGTPTQPAVPELVPSAQVAGPRVELEGQWLADTQRIRIRVYIAGFSNLVGVAGHLRYDPTRLALQSLTSQPTPTGPAKDASTWTARALAKDSPTGRILLGGARFRTKVNPFATVEGAVVDRELWATAEFTILQAGSHAIAFDPESVVARSDEMKDVPASWGAIDVIAQGGAL